MKNCLECFNCKITASKRLLVCKEKNWPRIKLGEFECRTKNITRRDKFGLARGCEDFVDMR
jgi:hypothetical protein